MGKFCQLDILSRFARTQVSRGWEKAVDDKASSSSEVGISFILCQELIAVNEILAGRNRILGVEQSELIESREALDNR
jgi:hypothetical protein